ncbi:hypothetical protein Salat_2696500 [Sesamum alatum]|uniref:Membrane-associated kinase regulator 6 n=1 Tax=Sesamum alatum TaxID=300844 RepID=A0AAE1XQX4_9LAMI|nr:hypothetical protein Salat_2696500 [Sesamum alatum]
MENSQPLATESFSYSWLTVTDTKPSPSDNLRPKLPDKEPNNFNFDVPVSTPPTALVHADEIFSDGQILPVYIDRSSSVVGSTTNNPANSSPACHVRSPTSSPPPRTPSSSVDKDKHFLYEIKWRSSNSPTRILHKCLKVVVRQLCKGIGWSRKRSRVDDLERKAFEIRSWRSYNSLEAASPFRSSSANYSVVDIKKIGDGVYRGSRDVERWRSSSAQASPSLSPCRSTNVWFDAENSIHEAILYCKRSIGTETVVGIRAGDQRQCCVQNQTVSEISTVTWSCSSLGSVSGPNNDNVRAAAAATKCEQLN